MPDYLTDRLNDQVVIAGTHYTDGLPRLLKVIPENGGLLTLPPILGATFRGKQFFYTEAFELAATTDQKDYIIKTPDTTKWCHLIFTAEGSAITEVMLFEDTQYESTDGTELTVFNNNRNSTDANTTLLYETSVPVTSTDSGTRIHWNKSGSATNQSKNSGETQRGDEIFLKQNTQYRLFIGSGSADNLCNIVLHWHEHTNSA